jgi:glutathione S-transferase
MKLYDAVFAPSPRRVRIFLAEKGITVPTVLVDMTKDEQHNAEFLRLNPCGELPVLVLDDGTALTESIAICRYLEALHPTPPLFGRSPLEQARIEMWALRLMFRVYVPITQVFRNTHSFWAGRIEQVPEYGQLSHRRVMEELPKLDAHLAQSRYLAGDEFSFADIIGFTTIDFGKPSNVRIQPEHTNLKRWYDEIAARPSAKA